MTLKDILSISGKPGLYRFVAKGRTGLIVESLNDKSRIAIPVTANASTLADISIYTNSGELPLHQVLSNLKEHHQAALDLDLKNDAKGVEALFATVAPSYNAQLVHLRDMQKAINWYKILTLNGIDDFTPPQENIEENKNIEK